MTTTRTRSNTPLGMIALTLLLGVGVSPFAAELGKAIWLDSVLASAAETGATLAAASRHSDSQVARAVDSFMKGCGVDMDHSVRIDGRGPGYPATIVVEANVSYHMLPPALVASLSLDRLSAQATSRLAPVHD